MHARMLILGVAAALAGPPPVAPGDGCGCDFARLNNAWCRACEVGYVAGVTIRSQALHEALDAHGHETDRSAVRCPTCCDAIESDGLCIRHRVGYYEGKLYASRLSWALARGSIYRVEDLTCDTCRANAGRLIAVASGETVLAPGQALDGWCAECGVGMVGNVAFCSRAAYLSAVGEFRNLARLVETARRCERCAGAQFFGTYCSRCRIRYDAEGTPTPE